MTPIEAPRAMELAQAGSTNDEAFRLLEQDPRSSLLIWTTNQTSGRGSRGRRWLSPMGTGLAVSGAFVCPPLPHPGKFCYPLFAAVWLHEALSNVFPRVEFHLKWPNDLLLDGKKLAGILCESRLVGDVAKVVLGLGINLGENPAFTALDRPYTTLGELPFPKEPSDIITALSESFASLLTVYQDGGLTDTWLARCGMDIGQRLIITQGRSTLHGSFAGLSQDGCLLLRSDRGTIHTFSQTLEDCRIVKSNQEGACS